MSDAQGDEKVDRDLVASNLTRATTLIGSSMAVLTFLLFFLFPRYANGQIDPILFHVTVGMVVLAIFSFGFSGICYYAIIGIPKMNVARKRLYARRGDLFFVLGILFAVSEPALILFTIGIVIVALLASGLWIIFTLFLLRHARELVDR